MSTEPTDAVLRLKLAFAKLPMSGLLFWEALLFFKDAEYKKMIEEKFINIVHSFSQNNEEAKMYYQQVLEDLKEVRQKISNGSEPSKLRKEIINIRDAIIAKAAYEMAIHDMHNSSLKTTEKR